MCARIGASVNFKLIHVHTTLLVQSRDEEPLIHCAMSQLALMQVESNFCKLEG